MKSEEADPKERLGKTTPDKTGVDSRRRRTNPAGISTIDKESNEKRDTYADACQLRYFGTGPKLSSTSNDSADCD